jgi:hypothetical protein
MEFIRKKMTKRILLATTAIAGSLLFTGCATIISGSTQNVSFNSQPEGATVMIDGIKSCATPCTISLPKTGKEKTIAMAKEGFETYTLPMTSSYNGVALLNIFWDLSTTDLITGAAFEYKPNNYYIELKAK